MKLQTNSQLMVSQVKKEGSSKISIVAIICPLTIEKLENFNSLKLVHVSREQSI